MWRSPRLYSGQGPGTDHLRTAARRQQPGGLVRAERPEVLSGIASWSVTAPRQQRAIALSPEGTGSLAVSLNAAVLYLAISLSSVTGAAASSCSVPARGERH
jgi:hypothetical protein